MKNKIEELLHEEPVVINVGLRGFADNLKEQGVELIQVDWVPPAGGDEEMIDLLEKLL